MPQHSTTFKCFFEATYRETNKLYSLHTVYTTSTYVSEIPQPTGDINDVFGPELWGEVKKVFLFFMELNSLFEVTTHAVWNNNYVTTPTN